MFVWSAHKFLRTAFEPNASHLHSLLLDITQNYSRYDPVAKSARQKTLSMYTGEHFMTRYLSFLGQLQPQRDQNHTPPLARISVWISWRLRSPSFLPHSSPSISSFFSCFYGCREKPALPFSQLKIVRVLQNSCLPGVSLAFSVRFWRKNSSNVQNLPVKSGVVRIWIISFAGKFPSRFEVWKDEMDIMIQVYRWAWFQRRWQHNDQGFHPRLLGTRKRQKINSLYSARIVVSEMFSTQQPSCHRWCYHSVTAHNSVISLFSAPLWQCVTCRGSQWHVEKLFAQQWKIDDNANFFSLIKDLFGSFWVN